MTTPARADSSIIVSAADGCESPGMRRLILTAAMDRYIRGESEDFNTLYQLLAPRLTSLLLARGCNAATAEDLLQQAFLRIHRARGRYKPGRDVAPWIVVIVRRLYVDHWRRGRREVFGDPTLETREDASDPEAAAIADELATEMLKRFSSLPLTQRRAFELVRLHGLSLAQAAVALGTTVSGVKLRLHRVDNTFRSAVSGTDGTRVCRSRACLSAQ